MMKVSRILVRALILCIAPLIFSCSDDNPVAPSNVITPVIPSTPPGELTTTFDVEWSSNTVVLTADDVKVLRVDTTAQIYYLPESVTSAANLKVGDIVLFYGYRLRRVKGVSKSGGEVVIETSDATLNEAIKKGKIGWDFKPDFEQAHVPSIIIGGQEVRAEKITRIGKTIVISQSIGSYNFKITLVTNKDSMQVSIAIAEKSGVDLVTSELSATGNVRTFVASSAMEFADNKLQNFQTENKKMSGDLTFGLKVEAGGTVLDSEIPVVLMRFPFLVGPIPVEIRLTLMAATSLAIPLGGSAELSTRFIFDADAGINYDGTTFKTIGQVNQLQYGSDSGTVGAHGAMAAEYAVAFPRVEVSILAQSVVPYIHLAYLLRGDYSLNDLSHKSCATAKAGFAGVIGVALKPLGINVAESYRQVFYQEKTFLKTPGCD